MQTVLTGASILSYVGAVAMYTMAFTSNSTAGVYGALCMCVAVMLVPVLLVRTIWGRQSRKITSAREIYQWTDGKFLDNPYGWNGGWKKTAAVGEDERHGRGAAAFFGVDDLVICEYEDGKVIGEGAMWSKDRRTAVRWRFMP